MEKLISEEELEKVKNIEGKTRGTVIKGILGYIRKRRGKGGLEKLESLLEKFDVPVRHDNIKEIPFYPLKYEAVILLLAERLFDFGDEDFRKMGEGSAKLSFVVRNFLKYFSSISLAAKDPLNMFHRYYRPGELEVVEIDEQEGRAVVTITKDFQHYPVHCRTLEGFLAALVKMITKSREVKCRETKCPHEGGDHHEFLVEW